MHFATVLKAMCLDRRKIKRSWKTNNKFSKNSIQLSKSFFQRDFCFFML